MAVYVDDRPVKLPNGINSHLMTADKESELIEMIRLINLDEQFVSKEGEVIFAIVSKSKKKLALNNGAISGIEAIITKRAVEQFKEQYNEKNT